jgi:DNA-binding beta-propeller fold protein YncE
VLDWNNHRVRRVETDDTLTTVIGTKYEGDGPVGEGDRLPLGDAPGAPGTEVALNHPTDIDFMPDGTIVLAAWHNNKIRVMDPETGIVKVLGGDSYGYAGDGEEAYKAVFNQPKAIVCDGEGQVYTNDQRNQRIRLIDAGEPRTIRTIAGDGTPGFSGDGGSALDAQFYFDYGTTPVPTGALALRDGVLYVADSMNNRIRAIDLESGIIDTVAGDGEARYAGDGGPALEASFRTPLDLEFGPDGRLYVADAANNAIRAIDLEADVVETVAGTGEPCPGTFNCFEAEEGLPAAQVQLAAPYGIAFDATGNLYIADTNNSRIVRIAK